MYRLWGRIAVGLVFFGALGATAVGYAQMAQPGGFIPGPRLPARHVETPVAPPPALPGATGGSEIAPGASAIDNENPTKVLFSAINHGAYAEARAAVSRGADLEAHNALGETPVELSIDLGRNNITFMLLSVMHEEGSYLAQPVEDATIPPVSTLVHNGPAGRDTARKSGRQTTGKLEATASQVVLAPLPPSNPPGLAAPQRGFFGFGNQ